MYTLRVLTLRLLLLLPLAFALHADQVVLKNGDTITGSIVKKDGDKLTIKSEFLGEVSMPWTAVQQWKRTARGPIEEDSCAENNENFYNYDVRPIPQAKTADF